MALQINRKHTRVVVNLLKVSLKRQKEGIMVNTSTTPLKENKYVEVSYFLNTNLPDEFNTPEEKEYFENMTKLFYELGWQKKYNEYNILEFSNGKQSVTVSTNMVIGIVSYNNINKICQSLIDSKIVNVTRIVTFEEP